MSQVIHFVLSLVVIFLVLGGLTLLMIRRGYFPRIFPEYSNLYSGTLTSKDGIPEGITIIYEQATQKPEILSVSPVLHLIVFGNLDLTIKGTGDSRLIRVNNADGIKIKIDDTLTNQYIEIG